MSDDPSAELAETELDEGSVLKAILVMAGPMLFGVAAVMSVTMIDTLYVGQLGKAQLAALSFAFPVTTVVSGLSLGLSAGAASVVSRAIGEDDRDGARTLSLHTLLLGILVTGLVALLGFLIAEPLFKLIGADETTLDYILTYMRIWFIAVPFLSVAMMCDFIVRATGNSVWPSIVMTGGSLFNIGITGLLVFGVGPFPELGIEGAAAGTLIAQVLTVVAGIWMVTWKAGLVDWTLPDLRKMIPSWWATAKVALPASLGNMVHPFTLTVITAILATFSQDVVAAFGVATQVELIATIPLLALSSALSPIAGQNWGAGKPDRIVRSLKLSYWMCVGWAALIALPLWFFGSDIATLFNSDGGIPEEAQAYLRIVPFSLFGYGMVICAAAAFNGIDEARRALGYNIVRSLVLFLPLAWIGARLADVPGVYGGIAAANVVSGLVIGWYAVRWLNSACKQARDGDADTCEAEKDAKDGKYPVPAE
ncbi:MAG: MATE family efflux transporter [Pseudomonadota bacterium]